MTRGPDSPRPPRIALVGLASWDRLLVVERIAGPGEYAVVLDEASLPGGTTSNSAIALARLGAEVALVGVVGDDPEGAALRAALQDAGVDVAALTVRAGERTDASTILVGGDPPDRTIYWHKGAAIVRGDRLDVPAIFAHDLVVLDVADHPLRRFLTDLPAHIAPRTRLLGTLTYLVDSTEPDELAVALRHDVLVGNQREWLALTGAADLDDATRTIQAAMPGANLRLAVASRGAAGCRLFDRQTVWDVSGFRVDAVDTTGAGDAFAAGLAYGLALRWPPEEIGRFANAVGALSTRALGAQAALPTLDDVVGLIETTPPVS
jgi:sugar/nucleoside kinase (ribokinase family)